MMRVLYPLLISIILLMSTVNAITITSDCGDGECGKRFDLFKDDILELYENGTEKMLSIYSIVPPNARLVSDINTTIVIEGQIKTINGTEYYIEYLFTEADGGEPKIRFILTSEYSICPSDCENNTIEIKCFDGVCNNEFRIEEGESFQIFEDGRHFITLESVNNGMAGLRIDGRTRVIGQGEYISINDLDLRLLRADAIEKYATIIVGDENVNTCPVDCTKKSCTETDQGYNFYEKGTTIANTNLDVENKIVYYDEPQDFVDECLTGPTSPEYYVKEWWCKNNTANSYVYTCPNGCSDGACLTNETNYCGDDRCVEGEICPEDCNVTNETECALHGYMPLHSGDINISCCEGLKQAHIKEYYTQTCEPLLENYTNMTGNITIDICIDCGDGTCDETFENHCNCPEDCDAPDITTQPPDELPEKIIEFDEIIYTVDSVLSNLETVKERLTDEQIAVVVDVESGLNGIKGNVENYKIGLEERGIFYYIMWVFGFQKETELQDAANFRSDAVSISEHSLKLVPIAILVADNEVRDYIYRIIQDMKAIENALLREADVKEDSAPGWFG